MGIFRHRHSEMFLLLFTTCRSLSYAYSRWFWPEPERSLMCELALMLRLFLRSGCSDSTIMAATSNPALSPATQEQLKWQHAAKWVRGRKRETPTTVS